MILVLFFLPIVLLVFTLFFGRRLGSIGVIISSCFVSVIQVICAVTAYVDSFVQGSKVIYNFKTITLFDGYDFSFGLLADRLSCGMLLIVTVISLAVQVYSIAYLRDDPHRTRFCLYLQLFTFFMLFLVLSPNYFQLFLGWEGVGLTSYLLVNFWYTRIQANKSGLKALFVNRIGDFFYMFALFFCLMFFNSTDFEIVKTLLAVVPTHQVEFVCLLFILAAAAKSAQLGLHTWLPDAMEGPTPVSALIHAATMVTAGVFLMIRVAPLLFQAPLSSYFLLNLGALTALFAALTGSCQYDLKKVVAYSTCSQLGYMMAAAGANAFDTCFYHLVNHAFFKALLFLTAGIVIHSMLNDQDMRRYGGFIRLLPYSYMMMLTGSLGLAGMPFLSGYYSKENILESLLGQKNYFSYILLVLTAGVTAYYSVRTIYLVFARTPRYSLAQTGHIEDAEYLFLFPTLALFFLTLFHGYVTKDLYIGLAVSTSTNVLYSPLLAAEFYNSIFFKLIPLFVSFFGALFGFFSFKRSFVLVSPPLIRFFNKRWWFDYLDTYLSRLLIEDFYYVYKFIERGLNEILGSTGTSNLFSSVLRTLVGKMQNGSVNNILLTLGLALVILCVSINNKPLILSYDY
jgi:NADH-ubiquinone oxidoreductase chain 5